MRVLLTGTGGADGVPGFFSDSRVGRHAREKGGKELRTRTSAVIDGRIRIDFSADTYAQCQKYGLKPAEWEHIVFTHTHNDHYAPLELQYMFPPFVPEDASKPEIWGNQAVLDGIVGFEDADKLKTHLMRSFETYDIGGYEVTAIKAHHKLDEDSLNLIFRKDGRTFLYGTDTGVWQEETWSFLEGWKFDAAVIECSDGLNPGDYWGHLSCVEFLKVVARLKSMGCLANAAPVCTTHHADIGMATQEELEAFFSPHGVEVGFDGKVIEI